MRIQPIIPARRAEPFDDPAWAFELKLDGFRCIVDTVEGRLLSKQRNRLTRFGALLESLPQGYVFDGEIVCLEESGRPIFTDLLFRRRDPVYVAFDVLNVEGADVRAMPLKIAARSSTGLPSDTGCRNRSCSLAAVSRCSKLCASST